MGWKPAMADREVPNTQTWLGLLAAEPIETSVSAGSGLGEVVHEGHLVIPVDAPEVVRRPRSPRGQGEHRNERPRGPVPVQDGEVGERPGVRRAEVEDRVEDAFVGPGDNRPCCAVSVFD